MIVILSAVAYLEGDAFWPFIIKPSNKQTPHQRFTTTTRAVLGAAWHYHRDGYTAASPMEFFGEDEHTMRATGLSQRFLM